VYLADEIVFQCSHITNYGKSKQSCSEQEIKTDKCLGYQHPVLPKLIRESNYGSTNINNLERRKKSNCISHVDLKHNIQNKRKEREREDCGQYVCYILPATPLVAKTGGWRRQGHFAWLVGYGILIRSNQTCPG